MIETKLEMARRHVADGRERIRQQEILLEKLRIRGHESMLEEARTILAQMLELQAGFEKHLAELETRQSLYRPVLRSVS